MELSRVGCLSLMFVTYPCTSCSAVSRRAQCLVEPDGLYGPELLCPHCDAMVQGRPNIIGWALVLAAEVALSVGVYTILGRA